MSSPQKRLADLIELTHVNVVHDYEDTLYRLKLSCGLDIMISVDTIHNVDDETWQRFLDEINMNFFQRGEKKNHAD